MCSPLIPMLSLTGGRNMEKTAAMLDGYCAVGIDTVMLYPRSGLEIPYMSDAYLQYIQEITEAAKARGMHLWLYDEFNWPSGSCHNRVIAENKAFAAKRIFFDGRRATVETVGAGQAQMVEQPFDNDMLNPDAVDCFIALTHEVYHKALGSYFGNTIVGIFTDEPSFIYTANGKGMYPYYDGLEKDYCAACGNDLLADVEAFERGESCACFPRVFRELISDRFKSAYIDRVARWCKAHRLLLTGHTLDDENPLRVTRVTGNWFHFFENVPQPGVDEIPTKFGVHNDMLFSMIDNQKYHGKRHAMAELFALGPCSLSFARRKQMLFYAAAYGVDRYFIAISHLDGRGNIKKPDFFDNFNLYNPDFAGVKCLADDSMLAAKIAAKTAKAAVGVRMPYTAYLQACGQHDGQIVYDRLALLMDTLIKNQIPLRVLSEEEDAFSAHTVLVEKDGYRLENDAETLYNIKMLLKALLPAQAAVLITETDGTLPQDILAKQYDDGSLLVVSRENALKEKRTLVLRDGERRVPFDFYGFGVRYFESIAAATEEKRDVLLLSLRDMRFVGAADNVCRLCFLKAQTCTLTVGTDMPLRMHVRSFEGGDTVLVDGEPIKATAATHALTGCFDGLYKTAEMTLTKGAHTFSCAIADYPYLPAVILSGDFDVADAGLSARTGHGSFFGHVIFERDVFVDRPFVTLPDAAPYYTELLINGERAAVRHCAPYVFAMPTACVGRTVRLTFCIFSDISSLFGDLAAMREKGIFTPGWGDVPSSKPSAIR